jgi:hypothetical protein
MSISASSPVKERRLATLDPDNIEENGSQRVGTTPVTRSIEGVISHKGHLRDCTPYPSTWFPFLLPAVSLEE